VATLPADAAMPGGLDGATSLANCTMPVHVFAGPCFQAEGIEAATALADAEVEAEQPPRVFETFVGLELI
jgi:hypothetical protein